MFWKKKPAGELPKPKGMFQLLLNYLMTEMKQDPIWLWTLKTVMRPRPEGKDVFDVRVFDQAQVAAKQVTVRDYNSLDEHPTLILYQGRFDKKSGKVQIEEKKAT